jgi:BASS family bile acid:Na+ symporter
MLNAERAFPFLAVIVSLLAWQSPEPLLGLTGAIVPLLTIIMFSMGLTLRFSDFRRIWQKPQPVALGIILQFGLMPLIAWGLALLFALPAEVAVGLIIVGACAGGTASNVMTFLAKGDVALSVTMTTASTLWGVFLTPFLIAFYGRGYTEELTHSGIIDIDTVGMLLMIAKIVILPVGTGVLVNRWLPAIQKSVSQYLPALATGAILLIIAVIVASNADELAVLSHSLILAVVLHNLIGLLAGYGIARWNGNTEVEARTIALEVGMQNSGLGVALANSFFSPLTALPGALFSVWQNIAGAVLAAFWKWRTERQIRRALSKDDN